MSVKVIAELNPASTRRSEFIVDPQPVSDIINELKTGFPPSQARVCRNGEIITDFELPALDGDTLWIKFVPYGSNQNVGAGMKGGGVALATIGVIVAAAFSWTGVGAFVGQILIGAGIGLISGGTVLMNVNIPSLKDREKPETDPSVRGGKNQSRPYGRIPVLFGRHRVYPDLASNPHTAIIGNNQYFTQLFCGGYKDCVIDLNSFKLGETPLIEFSQTKDINKILSGADPLVKLEILQNGGASRLYPSCVHEEAVNAALQHEVDGDDGEQISGELIRTTPDNTDTINVDVFLYNGIGKYDSDGDLRSWSIEVKASYKKKGDPDSAWLPLGFFNGSDNKLSGSELKTKRYQITKSGLAPQQYDVKIERVTADSTNSNIIDQVYVGSIRSIKSVRPIRAERQRELTVIALRVMAAAKFNGIVDSFNYIAASKLPVYSGNGSGKSCWLASAETRNPAAMLLYALRGRAAQQSVDAGDIDWPSLESFYQWCEEHEYTCNAYLSESVTIAELLRMIGAAARADILRIDSKIAVVQDIERPSPVQLFTPKNTKRYSVTMFSADVPDAVSLAFIDEQAAYASSEVTVYNTADGNRIAEPETVQKTDLWGVTNSAQARRIGMYRYGCLTHRPFVHAIEVDIEYLLCNKGDWIQYAGDLALTGSVQGRIVEPLWSGNRCVGIRIDETAETAAGIQYAVRIRLADGTIALKDIASVQKPDMLYFTEPFREADAPDAGDVYAFGTRGQEVIDLIITDIQPQADLSAVLTCVEYSPAIFGVDEPDFILPEFENKITPVSGAVDSGAVSPNQWKLYVTYHDADYEPARPQGDGQSGGWHYAQTQASVWQSSKMAEAIDAGEWGLPVRIKNAHGDTDTNPVYLALTPQTKTLECDGDGNILAGLMPFASQAALFKWNVRIPPVNNITLFPGNTGELFDPMLGGFYSSDETGIVFSLAGAPAGVTINPDGLITVSADAELGNENSITVQALYLGEIYTAVLLIKRGIRNAPPRYLGTIDVLPETLVAVIIKGPVQGRVPAAQGDYVLAVASGTAWKAGRVYQWTGLAWEERDPVNYTDLYTRCFADGLDVPELTQEMGWFGSVFAKLLVAQRAFIEALEAQIIELRDGGVIRSSNFKEGEQGFRIQANGDAEFYNGTFQGTIEASDGFFGSIILSDEPAVTPKTYIFNAGEKCYNLLTIRVAINRGILTSGSYGNKNIRSLQFYSKGISDTGYKATYSDNTTEEFNMFGENIFTDVLSLTYNFKGKLLMAKDLPAASILSLLDTGAIYKDDDGFLKVK